jgi:hypothetical protein
MNAVKATLVCVFSGMKYNTPISIDVDTGAFIDIEPTNERPPENTSLEKEYVVYDEEIFHIQFDSQGSYFISPAELDDFQAHVMG